MLSELLGSGARAEVLTLLLADPDREYYFRELQGKTGFALRTVTNEVNRLVRLGLVRERRDGGRRYLKAETDHPAFSALSELVRLSSGVRVLLADALRDLPGVESALIFGSVARQEESAQSDVDLLVVGSVRLRNLLSRLRPVQDRIMRPIRPVLMKPDEFRERIKKRDHFLMRVLTSDPLYLIGSPDDVA